MEKIIAIPLRQGDVPVLKVEGVTLPADAKVSSELTVALGEATGHHHTLYPTVEGSKIRHALIDGKIYFEITNEWVMRHQEHNEGRIAPGVYKIGEEREYDPFAEAMKKVID